jgi:hypothetical protein
MNGPTIEDRLHRLVDGVEVPATTTALRAIERRTRVLRRRRHVGVVAAVGVVVAVVAGLSGRDDRSDVEVDPQDEEENGLPAFTLDLAGWDVVVANDGHDIPYSATGDPATDRSHKVVQSFRRPGDLLGPSVVLDHARELNGDIYGQNVTIRGVRGGASVRGDEINVTWSPDGGRTRAMLSAHGLTLDQTLEFAEGLEPVDDDIALPPGPDDRFGFDATVTVAGMVEQTLEAPETIDRRYVVFADDDGQGQVEITIDNAGEKPSGAAFGEWEQVVVEGRPVRMVAHNLTEGAAPNSQVDMSWMLDGRTRVDVRITAITPGDLDPIVAGLHEISDDDWKAIVAAAPPSSSRGLVGPGGG